VLRDPPVGQVKVYLDGSHLVRGREDPCEVQSAPPVPTGFGQRIPPT
jgi:hypothetical protein